MSSRAAKPAVRLSAEPGSSSSLLRAGRWLLCCGLAWLAAACSDESIATDTSDPPAAGEAMPAKFSKVGLYPAAPDFSATASWAFEYEPNWPLWSNGSIKQRFVAVPGADAPPPPRPGEYVEGTMFFKTFSYENDAGQLLPAETRVLRLGGTGWEYYRYLWNDTASDAQLLTTKGPEYLDVHVGDDEFEHEVPGELDCKRCHEASDDPVLGYREVQLGEPILQAAPNATTQDVMGYALGNCTHCHNGRATDANGFDLRPDVFLTNTINQETESSAAASGIRVVPGDPEASYLFITLGGGDETRGIPPMPAIGVQRRDKSALALFRWWIENLPTDVENN